MRFAYKLHHGTPPFVEICLETWRQDVHGGAPIISLQLMTSAEVRRTCANLRAQIEDVTRFAGTADSRPILCATVPRAVAVRQRDYLLSDAIGPSQLYSDSLMIGLWRN